MSEVPNLDAMSSDDLMAFWSTHQQGRKAKTLGLTGKGSRRAVADLANYAANKATAQRCRLAGDIGHAVYYENVCDTIYRTLPHAAIW